MKEPSEIWNSFSEVKGEKRAYVFGIGEGIRLSLEVFREDKFTEKDSLSGLVSRESYLKNINGFKKIIYLDGIKAGLEICSHYVEGIGEGIEMCIEKGHFIYDFGQKGGYDDK